MRNNIYFIISLWVDKETYQNCLCFDVCIHNKSQWCISGEGVAGLHYHFFFFFQTLFSFSDFCSYNSPSAHSCIRPWKYIWYHQLHLQDFMVIYHCKKIFWNRHTVTIATAKYGSWSGAKCIVWWIICILVTYNL